MTTIVYDHKNKVIEYAITKDSCSGGNVRVVRVGV